MFLTVYQKQTQNLYKGTCSKPRLQKFPTDKLKWKWMHNGKKSLNPWGNKLPQVRGSRNNMHWTRARYTAYMRIFRHKI